MKKGFVIVLVLACLLGLVACDPGHIHIDEQELLHNTVKIELYNYENTSPKHIPLRKNSSIPNFDFNKATLIAALEDSRFEDVITDIADQIFMAYAKTLNEPIGKTIVLYQANGNMVVIFGCTYENSIGIKRYYGQGSIYDENGVFVEYIGVIHSDYVDYLESEYFERAALTHSCSE